MAPDGNEGSPTGGTSSPSGPPSGVGVVLGGAECLWDDLDATECLLDEAGIQECDTTPIAVNDAGHLYTGAVDHWVSLHPEKFVGQVQPNHNPEGVNWLEMRTEAGGDEGYTTWSRRNPEWVDRELEHWGAGSSGLYAVTVALHLGLTRIILCGVPMDERPHVEGATAKDSNEPWSEWDIHDDKWTEELGTIGPVVRSWSGWTRELLGEPTIHWLTSVD